MPAQLRARTDMQIAGSGSSRDTGINCQARSQFTRVSGKGSKYRRSNAQERRGSICFKRFAPIGSLTLLVTEPEHCVRLGSASLQGSEQTVVAAGGRHAGSVLADPERVRV